MAFSFVEYLILLWKNWHNGRHFVSFVRYISGAKFEEYCSFISKELNNFSVLLFYWNYLWHHFPQLHNIKTSISLKCNSIKCLSRLFCIRPLYNLTPFWYIIAWRWSVYFRVLPKFWSRRRMKLSRRKSNVTRRFSGRVWVWVGDGTLP